MPIFSFELLAKTMGKGIPSTHQFVVFFFFGGVPLCYVHILMGGLHSFFLQCNLCQADKKTISRGAWVISSWVDSVWERKPTF